MVAHALQHTGDVRALHGRVAATLSFFSTEGFLSAEATWRSTNNRRADLTLPVLNVRKKVNVLAVQHFERIVHEA